MEAKIPYAYTGEKYTTDCSGYRFPTGRWIKTAIISMIKNDKILVVGFSFIKATNRGDIKNMIIINGIYQYAVIKLPDHK